MWEKNLLSIEEKKNIFNKLIKEYLLYLERERCLSRYKNNTEHKQIKQEMKHKIKDIKNFKRASRGGSHL